MTQSFSKEQSNRRSQSVKARRREGVWGKNKLSDGIKERQGRCTEARSDGGFDRTCTYSRVPGLGEQRGKKRKKHNECERAREGEGTAEQRKPATGKHGEQQEKGGKNGSSLECNHNHRFASDHKDEDDSSRRHKNICLESEQERRE